MAPDGDLEPIEPHVRDEVPPDDAHVVIRGGPVAAEKIVEHALRQAREYSLAGAPMWSVSVSLTISGWSVDEILAGPMASRSTIATSTVGVLRGSGYRLLATYGAPHFDLVLPGASYDAAVRLLSHFTVGQPNPYKRRRR